MIIALEKGSGVVIGKQTYETIVIQVQLMAGAQLHL